MWELLMISNLWLSLHLDWLIARELTSFIVGFFCYEGRTRQDKEHTEVWKWGVGGLTSLAHR